VLLGQVGEVRQEIGGDARKGLVMVGGELWGAVAREKIAVGERVRVVSMEGLLLTVEPYSGGGDKPSPKESGQ
jgi:membrane-bound ClpP family serine protease